MHATTSTAYRTETYPFESLPEDVNGVISKYLNPKDICQLCQVSRAYSKGWNNESVWIKKIEHDLGEELEKLASKIYHIPLFYKELPLHALYRSCSDPIERWKMELKARLPYTAKNMAKNKAKKGRNRARAPALPPPAALGLSDGRLVTCHPSQKGFHIVTINDPTTVVNYHDMLLDKPLCLAEMPDQSLIIGCGDGKIHQYKIPHFTGEGNKETYTPPTKGAIKQLLPLNNKMVAFVENKVGGSEDLHVMYLETRKGAKLTLEKETDREINDLDLPKITFLAKQPKGNYFAVGDRAGKVHIYSIDPLEFVKAYDLSSPPTIGHFDSTGAMLVACRNGGFVVLKPEPEEGEKEIITLPSQAIKVNQLIKDIFTFKQYIAISILSPKETSAILSAPDFGSWPINEKLESKGSYRIYDLKDKIAAIISNNEVYATTLDKELTELTLRQNTLDILLDLSANSKDKAFIHEAYQILIKNGKTRKQIDVPDVVNALKNGHNYTEKV